jgi:hypothetical protein
MRLLLSILALAGAAASQGQPAPANVVEAPGGGLRLLVLEGDGAVNDIQTGRATPPIVEVRDAYGVSVEGAEVTFELPDSGPGATFPGDRRSLTVSTNHQGQAAATGFAPNGVPGNFRIRVVARHLGQAAAAEISQSNSVGEYLRRPVRRSWIARWWKPIVIAGGGAAAVFFLTRGSNPVVTATPGPMVIGGPR